MNKEQIDQIKKESKNLYDIALQLDNSLAEKKKLSFTTNEFIHSVKLQNGNPLLLMNQLIAYGFIIPVMPQGHYKIQYFPQARKEALERLIKELNENINKLQNQKAKISEIKKLI